MDIASINIIAIHSTALKFSEVVANNFSINFTEIKNNACVKINTVKRANPDSVTISFIDIEFTDETKLSVIIDIKEIITRGTVAANSFLLYCLFCSLRHIETKPLSSRQSQECPQKSLSNSLRLSVIERTETQCKAIMFS